LETTAIGGALLELQFVGQNKGQSQISSLVPGGWIYTRILADYSERWARVPTTHWLASLKFYPREVIGADLPKVTATKL
jgi:hypothetical protein